MLCPSLRAGLARSAGYPINRPVEGQMPVRSMSDPEPARLSGWSAEAAVEDAVTYVTALRRRSVVTGGLQPPAEPPWRHEPTVDIAVVGLDSR